MTDAEHPAPAAASSSSSSLPEPTLSFTLPSLHDGLPLDCRVYHPHSLTASPRAPSWQKHAAIVAHPYAPLGGCYDDPVVDIVASTLLRLGFLVATFNFRGAHSSAGRTSWTAKAESADYMSVVGFVSHYVHFLDPFRPTFEREPTSPGLTSVMSAPATPLPPIDAPILLLSGYSYGAMVTTNLPALETVLAPFNTPIFGSPPAEIRLRAQHLAETQNAVLASARAAAIDRHTSRSPRKSLGLRVGGDEENRKSHDSRRSISSDFEERLHKGVTEFMAKARKGNRKSRSSEDLEIAIDDIHDPQKVPPAPEHLLPVPHRTSYRPAYLLVSPLQGVVTNLATMSFGSPLASLSRRLPTRSISWSGRSVHDTGGANDKAREPPTNDAEQKLVSHPTLAIYGDRDSFVPVRKLRDWASRLESMPSSKFRAHEVSSAGHFWVQGNVAGIMRDAVKTFAEAILRDYDV